MPSRLDLGELDLGKFTGAGATVPGGAPFTPSDLPSLRGWWKADDIAGAVAENPTEWPDVSGNGFHATQANTSLQPQYRDGSHTHALNGMPVTDWGLGGPYLDISGTLVSGLTAGTVFCVNRIHTTGYPPGTQFDTGTPVSFQGHPTTQGEHYTWTDGLVYTGFGRDTRIEGIDPLFQLDTWHMLMYSSTPGAWEMRINSESRHSEVTNTVAWNPVPSIGRSNANDPTYHDGLIAEIIFFSAALSATDRQKVEGYLAHKWGLATLLPAAHPYKSVAP